MAEVYAGSPEAAILALVRLLDGDSKNAWIRDVGARHCTHAFDDDNAFDCTVAGPTAPGGIAGSR